MTKKSIILLVFVSVMLTGCDKNEKLEYGDSGLPSNCRALISAAIDAWSNSSGTEEEFDVMRGSLTSINRNCGKEGHLW